MKNFLAYALLLALPFLGSCKKDADLVDCEVESGDTITTTLTKYAAPVQKFTVNIGPRISFVRTSSGSIIYVPNGLVRMDRQPLSSSPIEVLVREVTKRSEMIFTNTPTISNGQLLESAGMFNVAFQQDGQKLRLGTSSLTVTTTIPTALSTTNNMQLFLGLPDSANPTQVGSWGLINTQTAQDSSRITPLLASNIPNSKVIGFQMNLTPTIYNINLGSLNWINCDRFVTGSTTTVRVNVAKSVVNNTNTRVLLVFNTLTSVLTASLANPEGGIGGFATANMPTGYLITAVVLHQDGNQLYFGKETATIAANQQFTPTLRAVTEAELVAEINAL